MYLKSLELIGFKSFAERTKLEFEPGMTAIVGPNGCGKSNVADSVRWVLGEQSAKALRGSKMEDCIFNGTDTHKPLGMAEVTLTLADCEQQLGTDYNEVMITRRVYRDGMGEYFINKTACRLKDIQRLFMDTGIGTNAYSLMEQGRIDLILSSRPEDRREVFEEASGITKYKADKKEAIRKLEHAEANLLRLADIIREVRRQIISLQRQAGKARRYQALQEQLRGFDLFATRERLDALNQEINTLDARIASIADQEDALRQDVEGAERTAAETRAELGAAEKEIAETVEASVEARTDLDRARELIRVNRDRIQELRDLSERDTRDAQEARARLEQHRRSLGEVEEERVRAAAERDAAEQALAGQAAQLAQAEGRLEAAQEALRTLGAEAVDLESQLAKSQNELYDLEAQERTTVIRRERLAAEAAELKRTLELFESRSNEMQAGLNELQNEVNERVTSFEHLTARRADQARAIHDTERLAGECRARIAARRAQIEICKADQESREEFPEGARYLLGRPPELGGQAAAILGPFADALQPEPEYRAALEAVVRAWHDAVVVTDPASALEILGALADHASGSARLLAVRAPGDDAGTPAAGPGVPLLAHVSCSDGVRPLVERLLRDVRVVDDLRSIPLPSAPGITFVTRSGDLVRGNGSFERWNPDPGEISPVARRHLLAEWTAELADLERDLAGAERRMAELQPDGEISEESLAAARRALEESQRRLAQREGEYHVIAEETAQARERTETVAWEAGLLVRQQDSGSDRRTAIQRRMEDLRNRQTQVRADATTRTAEVRALESERAQKSDEVTDHRIRVSERRQHAEHVLARKEPLEARIRELEALIADREQGVVSYQERIRELDRSILDTEGRLQPLQDAATRHEQRLATARQRRAERSSAAEVLDRGLREKRAALDDVRKRKSAVEVELAEQRVRQQNLIERVTSEYHVTPEQLAAEPEPAWEDGARPDRDALETLIAEIRAKLEAMGPVNLVAIEEHRELEERYTFLNQQQDDLLKAKLQLMDLIRRINKTTTEMFSQTFQQVNANFQEMFRRLFGGGSAKLVLVNEEDVLESGIEIIARPPGKKLQTVSLLSGGERTMTAVALLFSLYMVKPSPFCVLDELDAALDEANIGRFVRMLKDFLAHSQFIVITHNRQTIGAADVLYGVTMEQSGVSKIVSVKFSHHEQRAEAEPAPTASDPGPMAPA